MLGLSVFRSILGQNKSNEVTTDNVKHDELEIVSIESPEVLDAIVQNLATYDIGAFARTSWMHRSLCKNLPMREKLKVDSPKVIELREQEMEWHTIFLNHPECRKDEHVPCDEKGLAHLRFLQIGGPKTARAIARGALTIDEALARKSKVETAILASLIIENEKFYRMNIHGREVFTVVGYIVDGSLSKEEAIELTVEQIKKLHTDDVRKVIDNGSVSIQDALKTDA